MSKFCTKCGNSIEEGQICNCQMQSQPQPPQQQHYQQQYQQQQYQAPQQQHYQQQYQQQQYQAPQQQQYQQQPQQQFNVQPADNRKTYSILSYIGILWLVGLFSSPEKFDPRVRFNVGQGIIASIFSTGIFIVVLIINFILTATTSKSYGAFGYDLYTSGPPEIIVAIQWVLILAAVAFAITYLVLGILNVTKNQDRPLPIIGNLAFYR